MRFSKIGILLLIFSISAALASILFLTISWTVVSVGLISFIIYSSIKFKHQLRINEIIVQREIEKSRLFYDEQIIVKLKIINQGSNWIIGKIREKIDDNVCLAERKEISIRVPPKSAFTVHYGIVPFKRADLIIGPTRIQQSDQYQLFIEDIYVKNQSIIQLHAKKETLDTAKKIAAKEHVEYSGAAKKLSLIVQEQEFDGLREYVKGDKARDIHWKSLQRFEKLLTKIYRKEGALDTIILLDAGRSMRLPEYESFKLDHAIDISIQLSRVLLSSYYASGILIFDENKLIADLPPSLRRGQFDSIVKALLRIPYSVTSRKNEDVSKINKDIELFSIGEDSEDFLDKLKDLSEARNKGIRGFGLEAAVKRYIATGKGKKFMFIIISDLISSRNAIIQVGKICQSSGNSMLVLDMVDDWYRKEKSVSDVPSLERLVKRFKTDLYMESKLRQIGSYYFRIGPADTVMNIVRAMRRGET